MSDNIYGFESTSDVEYDRMGLPVGTYKAMATSEQPDEKGRGVVVEWEVLEGPSKGKKGKVWYLSKDDNPTTANIARQNLKRIGDASGSPVSIEAPVKGRVLTLEVRQQKKNPDYTEVAKYHPEGYTPQVDAVPV